jgi:metallo-beta-lactamase family protein
MAGITFHGAVDTVTGSRHLLDLNGHNLLIDCGSFQGTKENRLRNWEPFPVPANEIERVFLTHAHIDHSGHIPRLCTEGFTGPIHSTHATCDLTDILLRDSAHIQEEDARQANEDGYTKHSPALPLYTVKDAEAAMKQFAPLHYNEDLFLDALTRIKFRDSGHILGAAFIDIKTRTGGKSRKIVFSGDVGRPDQPILRDPTQAYNADYLVLESTYGDRLHDRGNPRDELARVILGSIDRGGVLVIPSFAVGRTQTLLYVIRELEEEGRIPPIPVFVDSPMSIRATECFEDHMNDLDITARRLMLEGNHIFRPKQLEFAMSKNESMAINTIHSRAIIISSSGMATGGRVLHHLMQRLPHKQNTILFIGYQAEGTRGRTIMEGGETVKIHGVDVPVNAKVESISGYSGHGDYNELLAWLMGFNCPPEKTFIVHGEPAAAQGMAEHIQKTLKWDVVLPEPGVRYDLDL